MKTQLGKLSKESDGYKVVFNKVLNHPIEKVWNAITDPEELKYWFTDIEIDPKPGGKMTIRFRDEARTASYGEVVSIEPPHRFAWTWEGELAVWELERIAENKTKLTLTYTKLSADYAINAPAGFHALLDRLENRLDGSSNMAPFGTEENDPEHVKMKVRYAAAAYNSIPETIKNKPVVVEKSFQAPVERVWQALTDKQQMKEWYFDLDKFEAREGFSFQFTGEGRKGEKYVHNCIITEVIPQQKLQYSWEYEGMPGYSIVTFDLSEENGGTKLRLTHHGLETFPQDSPDFGWNSFNEGWNHIIGRSLPEYFEKQSVE